MDDRRSERFGRYEILAELGRGAMGVVYLASDPVLNRQVAMKTVDLSVEEPQEREFLCERLFRDARAAAVLKHPNIVAIYDVFEDAGRAYVVMEYIEGPALNAVQRALRKEDRRLPQDVMLRVSPEVAKLLKSNQNTYLPELEEILGKTVIVKSDPLLHQEKFDLA